MARHEAIKEKDGKALKKQQCYDVLILAKFQQHRRTFSEILNVFERMWDGHLERLTLSKNCISLINEEVIPVSSTLHHTEPTARQFAAAEVSGTLAERVIEPGPTK